MLKVYFLIVVISLSNNKIKKQNHDFVLITKIKKYLIAYDCKERKDGKRREGEWMKKRKEGEENKDK